MYGPSWHANTNVDIGLKFYAVVYYHDLPE